MIYKKQSAKLLLDNGKVFSGYSLGKTGTTIGEVCFNTGMTGYQEILTDPSYCGQLITMTYPHIGNYGTNKNDIESQSVFANGFIIKEDSLNPSNFRSEQTLDSYLLNNNIVGIQGIDTRFLTRIIRDEGAMNAIISSEILDEKKLQEQLITYPKMEGLDLAKEVTCKTAYDWNTQGKYKIAAIDYGIKSNILRLLEKEDCKIKVFPAQATFKEIQSFNPDGIFLSNGPGDPAAVTYAIDVVQACIDSNIPIFGICLGHQILALACGCKTFKLKFGHRGCNHPVKNLNTGIIEITSQNHGFSVDAKNLNDNIELTHISLNDQTIEGLKIKNKPIFSIQYHPESSPGPHDSRYLFKQFITNINNAQKN